MSHRSKIIFGGGLVLAGLAVLGYWSRGRDGGEDVTEPGANLLFDFRDVAASRGLGTTRSPSRSRDRFYIFENVGSGCALLDYDLDGRLDIFVNNTGGVTPPSSPGGPIRLVPGPGAALFRQLPDGSFEENAERAGVRSPVWGTGVAVGDVDNDGDPDLFVGAFGPNRFYRNLGDGTFRDDSAASGLDHSGFASSAVFLDFDRDGWLDLYVANYVEFDLDAPPNGGRPCRESGVLISCGPSMHAPAADVLYRNRGDGTFEDVSATSGVAAAEGAYGLGVAAVDFDADGWPDIYVANDTTANVLWRNRGTGTFEDVALFNGVALSDSAQGQSGMGVDTADVDGDGWPDIHVTNYAEESNALYLNRGGDGFVDRSSVSGLGRISFTPLGWGTRLVDFDLDGHVDLAVANGHVHPRAADLGPGLSFRQPMTWCRGLGNGIFARVQLTDAIARNHRGLASGDLDGDGDLDMLATVLDGPPVCFENLGAPRHRWIAFQLQGSRSNREGIGSRVEITTADSRQVREVTRGGSYLSSSEAVVRFGLGRASRIAGLKVLWPSGEKTLGADLKAGEVYVIREGDNSIQAKATP